MSSALSNRAKGGRAKSSHLGGRGVQFTSATRPYERRSQEALKEMKPRKIFPRLMPLVLAALLLNTPHTSTAQRRRRPAHTPARTAAPQATPTQKSNATQATTPPAPSPSSQPRAMPQPSPARADAQARKG